VEVFCDGEAYVIDDYKKLIRGSDGTVLWQRAEPGVPLVASANEIIYADVVGDERRRFAVVDLPVHVRPSARGARPDDAGCAVDLDDDHQRQ